MKLWALRADKFVTRNNLLHLGLGDMLWRNKALFCGGGPANLLRCMVGIMESRGLLSSGGCCSHPCKVVTGDLCVNHFIWMWTGNLKLRGIQPNTRPQAIGPNQTHPWLFLMMLIPWRQIGSRSFNLFLFQRCDHSKITWRPTLTWQGPGMKLWSSGLNVMRIPVAFLHSSCVSQSGQGYAAETKKFHIPVD